MQQTKGLQKNDVTLLATLKVEETIELTAPILNNIQTEITHLRMWSHQNYLKDTA